MPGRTSIRHSYAAVVISILSEHIVGVLHRGFLLLSHCYFFGDSCSHMFFYNFFFIFFYFFDFGLYALLVIESIRYGDTR